MKIKIVNRKYIIHKFFRFEKIEGIQGYIGLKIALGKYEIRIYK
jgi:hypothetical protein